MARISVVQILLAAGCLLGPLGVIAGATEISPEATAHGRDKQATTDTGLGTSEIVWAVKRRSGPAQHLDFVSLKGWFPSGNVTLSGGQTVDVTAWVSITVARRGDGAYCTATLIGPRTILTAGHCVDDGATQTLLNAGPVDLAVSASAAFGGRPIDFKNCAMDTDYAAADIPTLDIPRSSDDYALCELATPVSGVVEETLDLSASIASGDPILMTGFGCTQIRVDDGELADTPDLPGQETLRMADAAIDAVDVLNGTGAKASYLRTRSRGEEPALCFGDSGGPVFHGASLANQAGPHRRVLAVNSKVSAVPDAGAYAFLSFVSPVTNSSFKAFLAKWVAMAPRTRGVCGYNIAAGRGNCHI